LKRRCVAAHCLHQALSADILESFLPFVSEPDATLLLKVLQASDASAAAAVNDEDLATAFQEALFCDWGDGVAAVEEALENAARLSHRHGSGVFFLTQQAGASNAAIRLLSVLYRGTERRRSTGSWDRARFAEAPLLEAVRDVVHRFLESDRQDGHLIDPHVWRNAGESGGKVALYCTAFAGVVLEILRVLRSLDLERFAAHKQFLFPVVCALVQAHSEEVRQLVQEVLLHQVGPLIEVSTSQG